MWWGLFVLAVALGAGGFLLDARWGGRTGRVSLTRTGLGLAVTLLAVVMGGVLIGVDVQRPPEQRGIGVLVDGIEAPRPGRGFDRGLTLSMGVRVSGCGDPVEVQLTLTPTAEFWIDNHDDLARPTTVRFAVPDDAPAGTPGDSVLSGLDAWTGTDGLAPFTTADQADDVGTALDATATKDDHATFVDVEVPAWSSGQSPLTVRFLADWTRHRTFLGGCYVTLPAVAGLPTVLSTAQLAGKAVPSPSLLPTDTFSVFVVSSREAGLYAYYDVSYEVTRGVTALDLGDNAIQEADTFPAPNANLGGDPAWTCRSSIPQTFGYRELEPGAESVDVYAPTDVIEDGGTTSFSDSRQGEILDQSTCASFVAIEAASAGTRRDLLLIAVGTVIALGVELLIAGLHRRRPGPDPSRSSG